MKKPVSKKSECKTNDTDKFLATIPINSEHKKEYLKPLII